MKSKAVLTAILLLSILLPVILFVSNTRAETAAGDALLGKKICLDPGHGGTDPGAINTLYDLEESDINLEVSYGVRYLLEGAGATVVMARSGDEYRTNSDRYTFCNLQKADILISVHTNSHTDLTWDGTMTLYGPRESPELAQALHNVMYPYLRDTRPTAVPEEDFVDYGVDRFASGVLFKSDMPAAMVEPLLMSNTYEAPLLVTHIFEGFDPAAFNYDYDSVTFVAECPGFSCRRGQIAQAVYEGTLAYFDAQPGDPPGGDMYVEAIIMGYSTRGRSYAINTAVTIHDSTDQPVPAAEVTLQVTFPNGGSQTVMAQTDADGVASFRTKTTVSGTYEAAVLNVTKVEWAYASELNVENSESLTIP